MCPSTRTFNNEKRKAVNDLVEEIVNNLEDTFKNTIIETRKNISGEILSFKQIKVDLPNKDVWLKYAKSAIKTILNNFKSKDYGDFENAIDELEKALNDE